MDEIQKSIGVYEKLRKFRYKISIENGMELELHFGREHYHHLAGFQHLTDMPDVADPVSRHKFYNDLRYGRISADRIKKSIRYTDIQERMIFFDKIEDILSPGAGKIIVEFNRHKTGSVIEARFHLFRREGNPFDGEAVFFTLFIDAETKVVYYPVTYVVEHSNLYVRGQNMYDCSIEKLPLRTKRVPAGV